MEHAIAKMEHDNLLESRACARMLTLDRDLDGDQDVAAFRAAKAHDQEIVYLIDWSLRCAKKLQRLEDDVAAGKVIPQKSIDFVGKVKARYTQSHSLQSRCAAIQMGAVRNGRVAHESAQHRAATVITTAEQNYNAYPGRNVGFWRGLWQITWWILTALFWLAVIGLTCGFIMLALMSPMMSMTHTGMPGLRPPRSY